MELIPKLYIYYACDTFYGIYYYPGSYSYLFEFLAPFLIHGTMLSLLTKQSAAFRRDSNGFGLFFREEHSW